MATFQHAAGTRRRSRSIWHRLDERPSTRHLEVFFEGGYFATDHDFIGPIRYQQRTGEAQEMSADEVFERYCQMAGLEGQEAELARRGMYEDYAFLRCVARRPARVPGLPDGAARARDCGRVL